MTWDPHKNFSYAVVATPPSPATSGTSLTLNTGAGSLFPQPSTDGAFNVTIWPTNAQPTTANAEIARCTARSGDVLTITRAQEGTSARSVGVGDQIALTMTAKVITDIETSLVPVVNVEAFGAVHNGTTDDSTAINNAIAALPATGGVVYFPAGDYACASTINIGDGTSSAISTRQGVYLQGVAGPLIIGMAAGISPTGYGAVRLKWTGAAAGTLLSVNGPLVGWGLKNLYLDGASSANYGLTLVSAQGGDTSNLAVTACKVALINCNTVASFSGFVTNTMHNSWRNIFLSMPPIAGTTRAIVFDGQTTSNTCYEEYTNVTIGISSTTVGNTVTAIVFRECDNIHIRDLHFALPTQAGTVYPLYFNYSGVASWPSDCTVESVDFGSHYTAVAANTGTPSGAQPNRVVNIAAGNSGGSPPADPSLANLKWGYTAANP